MKNEKKTIQIKLYLKNKTNATINDSNNNKEEKVDIKKKKNEN